MPNNNQSISLSTLSNQSTRISLDIKSKELYTIQQTIYRVLYSGMLSVIEYKYLSIALKIPINSEDLIINCRIQCKGKQRLRLWRIFLFESNRTTNNEQIIDYYNDINNYQLLYKQCLNIYSDLSDQNSGQFGEIGRDVVRTFQNHSFFYHNSHSSPINKRPLTKGVGMLKRVLVALIIARPEIGYCQGMNFVVALLILIRLSESTKVDLLDVIANYIDVDSPMTSFHPTNHLLDSLSNVLIEETESDVFETTLSIVDRRASIHMSTLWRPDVPQMKLRVYQMDKLLQWHLPNLYNHFLSIQLAPEVLVAQWFLTLFSYTMTPSLTIRIWDYTFYGGWCAMFRVGLSLLQSLESSLLCLDLEGVGDLMRDWKKSGHFSGFTGDSVDFDILRRCRSISVTDELLEQLQESFALEMISISESSLASDISTSTLSTNWLSRYGDSIDEKAALQMIRVRDDLIELQRQTDIDKQYIQSKITRACEMCRQVEEKHFNLLGMHSQQLRAIQTLEIELQRHIVTAQQTAERASEIEQQSINKSNIKSGQLGGKIDCKTDRKLNSNLDNKADRLLDSREDMSSDDLIAEVQRELDELSDGSRDSNLYQSKLTTDSRLDSPIDSELVKHLDSEVVSEPYSNRFSLSKRLSNKLPPWMTNRPYSQKQNKSPINYSDKQLGDTIDSKINSKIESKTETSIDSKIDTKIDLLDDELVNDQLDLSIYSITSSDSDVSTKNDDSSRFSFRLQLSPSSLFTNNKPNSRRPDKQVEKLENRSTDSERKSIRSMFRLTMRSHAKPSDETIIHSNNKSDSQFSNLSTLLSSLLTIGVDRGNDNESILQQLADQTQTCQQNIVNTHRLLGEAKESLRIIQQKLDDCKIELEEASDWKRCLCDQFQTLVQDSNRGRKQKIQFLTETYKI